MTAKDKMTISIDPDIAWQFKRQVEERHRSRILENFMRTYCEENEEGLSEQKLREERELLDKNLKELRERIGVLDSKLSALSEKQKVEKRERLEAKRMLANSMKAAGVLSR